jgi:hypothetical protein
MPWFLNPNVYNNLPVYQNPETYLFIFKLTITAIFTFLLWKQGKSKRHLIGITYIFFYGTFITVMLFMHNFVILGLRIFEPTYDKYLTYDFHLYSLILLGSLLFLQGIRSLQAALLLKEGDEKGFPKARRATLFVLAVSVPLIPIQFFGIVLTVISLLNLGVIKLLLLHPGVSPQSTTEETILPTSSLGFNS